MDNWPYVCYTQHPWPEVCEWCQTNIGEFDQEWYKLGEDIAMSTIDPNYRSTYLFKQHQHAVLFELKWS